MIDATTIPGMFFHQANMLGDKVVMLFKRNDRYRPITWRELAMAVRETAAGLISLGVRPGDRVAIMAYNSPAWAIADLAIMAAGCVSVPVYHTSTPSQATHILRKSGVTVAFVGRSDTADLLLTCSPQLKNIIDMAPLALPAAGGCFLGHDELRKRGANGWKEGLERELERRMAALSPRDCATIIYTSGTTGGPKGVMLSHQNILSNAAAGIAAQPVGVDDVCLSFLPLSHAFERTVGQFLMLMAGATIAYAGSIRSVPDNLREVRPTIVLGVPRFFEKLHQRITDALERASPFKRGLVAWAMNTVDKFRSARESGNPHGWAVRMQYTLAKGLVLRPLHRKLGGRLKFFVSGGAPLSSEITRFFLSADIPVLEGYGLTEASPVVTVNRLDKVKPGTVGRPLRDVRVRLAEDGEIAVAGDSVMLGYYRDQQATDDAIRDGWLYTGDVGVLDADGYLRITDRKKEIIVTSAGKNIAPQPIERQLATDKLIAQAVIYGDDRRYLTAVVVPDFDQLRSELKFHGIRDGSDGELCDDPSVNELVLAHVRECQESLASFERVKKIVLTSEPFTEQNGLLTPTLKIKRKAVVDRYRSELDDLYDVDVVARNASLPTAA